MSSLAGALWAKAFDHIVDALHPEAFGNGDQRHRRVFHAEDAMTESAIEMDMQIIIAVAVTMANLILHLSVTIFHRVNQMMLSKQHQAAEDAALVHREQPPLQVTDRRGGVFGSQGAHDKDAVARRLDAVGFQELNTCIFIHNCKSSSFVPLSQMFYCLFLRLFYLEKTVTQMAPLRIKNIKML